MFNQKILVQASLFILGLLVGFGLLYSFKSYLPYSERENKVNYTNNNVKPVTTLAVNNKEPSKVRELAPGGYVINDSLYYSPTLKLVLYGFLGSLSFNAKGFSPCDNNACDNVVSLLTQDDTNLSPLSFINNLIKASGGNPDQCRIDKDQTSTNFAEVYRVTTKKEVIFTDEELFTEVKQLHSNEVFLTIKDYEKYCKINGPNCSFDENILKSKMSEKLCSKYVSAPLFKGSSYFLFRMDGNRISTDKGTANALFIKSEGGNGGAPDIQSVQLVN